MTRARASPSGKMKSSTPNKREDEGIMAEMKDAAFLAEADSWIDAHWEEIVEEIGNLVAVPSVVDFDAATPEHPAAPTRTPA